MVTARFVSENVQDTPIAITALNSTQLKAANITNISTLGAVVPNLLTVPGDSESAGTPTITMRGVTQGQSSSLAIPPAVAIYTDDVYHSTTAGSDLNLNDIDRIEVNRGPQSTLSGNASIGGSIQVYTKDPTGDGSGYLDVTGGSLDLFGISGAKDVALSPTLALRVSASLERQDGFENRLDFTCEMNKLGTPALAGSYPEQPAASNHNCIVGQLGGYDHTTAQAKLRWRPTDKLDVIFTASKHIENDQETPEVALAYNPNPNPNPNAAIETYNIPIRNAFGIVLDNRFLPPPSSNGYATYATNCRPKTAYNPSGFCYAPDKTADNDLFSTKIHYDITDDVRMTAIGAYTQYSNEFTQNGDESPLGYVMSHFENQDYQWTGEVRFDGKAFDNKLNWVVGGFLMRFTGFQKNSIDFEDIDQDSVVKGTNNTQSGFFHLDYNITDRWRVSGGARYTDGEIAIIINNPTAVSISAPVQSIEHRGDWLLSTDYKLTDNILAYANAASGSRPPGLNTIVNTPRQVGPTPAEELISYETGLKTELFEQHLRMNVSAFYTDYKSLSTSFQGYECVGQPGATATWYATAAACQQFANTGSAPYVITAGIPAKISGFEWEATALPIQHLHIDYSGGYNHYESGITTPGQPGYLYPGNHRQPTWNMHADGGYDIDTPFGRFTPRVDVSWQSQQDYDPESQLRAPLPIFIIPAYSLLNGGIAFVPPDGKWTANFAVTNMTDKFYHYQVLQGSIDAQTRLAPPR